MAGYVLAAAACPSSTAECLHKQLSGVILWLGVVSPTQHAVLKWLGPYLCAVIITKEPWLLFLDRAHCVSDMVMVQALPFVGELLLVDAPGCWVHAHNHVFAKLSFSAMCSVLDHIRPWACLG